MSAGFDGPQLLALLEGMGARVFRSTLPELAAPVESRALREALRQVASGGGTRVVEHPLPHPDGLDGWARTTLVRAAGDPGAVVGAMLDISEARSHERQWQELESWLVSLGEALPFDFWIADRSGRCVLQNPASTRRLGPALGQRFEELVLPDGWLEVWDRGFRRALGGEPSRQELHCTLEAEPRHLVRVISPVRGEEGIQGALGVDLDVTHLKQAEARLRESLAELARTQDALVRRRELAALGEMAAVVAHEIRNPLGTLANVSALLRRSATPGDEPELCQILEDEVSRLDGLVRALLDFVRPLTPELQARPLAPVVEAALDTALRSERADGRIRVQRRLDPSVAGVPLDQALLQIALGNVLRNALQAMPEGGELEVSVERDVTDARGWARVVLRDSGPGLPAEVEARLFQPFVTTRPTGCGMGLAIVKRIIDGHRGEVRLHSAGEGGTTCVIRLPIVDTPQPDAPLEG